MNGIKIDSIIIITTTSSFSTYFTTSSLESFTPVSLTSHPLPSHPLFQFWWWKKDILPESHLRFSIEQSWKRWRLVNFPKCERGCSRWRGEDDVIMIWCRKILSSWEIMKIRSSCCIIVSYSFMSWGDWWIEWKWEESYCVILACLNCSSKVYPFPASRCVPPEDPDPPPGDDEDIAWTLLLLFNPGKADEGVHGAAAARDACWNWAMARANWCWLISLSTPIRFSSLILDESPLWLLLLLLLLLLFMWWWWLWWWGAGGKWWLLFPPSESSSLSKSSSSSSSCLDYGMSHYQKISR